MVRANLRLVVNIARSYTGKGLGLQDLIEEGKTGFTFSVGDCKQLARQLETMAGLKQRGHDFRPALASKLRNYSIEAAVGGTMEAIETVVHAHKPEN